MNEEVHSDINKEIKPQQSTSVFPFAPPNHSQQLPSFTEIQKEPLDRKQQEAPLFPTSQNQLHAAAIDPFAGLDTLIPTDIQEDLNSAPMFEQQLSVQNTKPSSDPFSDFFEHVNM